MLNRIQAPTIEALTPINWLAVKEQTLANKVSLAFLQTNNAELLKVELIFKAGSKYYGKPCVANFAVSLLNEGTRRLTGYEFHELVDGYGAYLQLSSDRDHASITLYTLQKHIEHLLPILQELIFEPRFDARDLDVLARNRQQNFFQEQEKASNRARVALGEALFGAEHMYGVNTKASDYLAVTRDDLLDYHKTVFLANSPRIVVVGQLDAKAEAFFVNTFQNYNFEGRQLKTVYKSAIQASASKRIDVPMNQGSQSSIRLGKTCIPMQHPDYHSLKMANTILGGYFGSRLMQNIREDKGYTYGISSAILHLEEADLLVINTSVGNEFVADTLKQIQLEIERLQNELVSDEELYLVKQYKSGAFFKMVDGAFAQADILNAKYTLNVPPSFYQQYLSQMQAVTALQIQQAMKKYITWNDLHLVVAGKQDS